MGLTLPGSWITQRFEPLSDSAKGHLHMQELQVIWDEVEGASED